MMAHPTCEKCDSHIFETKEICPINLDYKLTFVQCAECGGPVGVMESCNLGAELQEVKQKLGEQERILHNIENLLAKLVAR